MMRAALLALVAAPAFADSQRVWPGGVGSNYMPSVIEMHAPTDPGAVATITFENEPVHSRDESFQLTWSDITVTVLFVWNVDGNPEESITVEPPEGYVAVPREISVRESQAGVIHIIKWRGM